MIILWLVTGASLVVSLVALFWVRRTVKRLEDLSQQYWALRYQQGELRAYVQATSGGAVAPQDTQAAASRAPAEAFVPLSAVRR